MSQQGDRATERADPTAGGGHVDVATEAFVAHRDLLFTVAYEMIG